MFNSINITNCIKTVKKSIIYILFILLTLFTNAQQKKFPVNGTVYDISAKNPIEAVSVFCSNGNFTTTDSFGKYSILVGQKDSLWFSMLGKATSKYPIDTIKNFEAFDVMIHVKVADLPEVKVRTKNYKQDSISNRQEYAKIFNFKKPGLSLSNPNGKTYIPGQLTTGFDLQELISIFQFKKNKSISKLRERLLQQEKDKYIDYRYNKAFVRKITKLPNAELDLFMKTYRPNYEFLLTLNDLEFGYFIQRDLEHFKKNKWKQRNKY